MYLCFVSRGFNGLGRLQAHCFYYSYYDCYINSCDHIRYHVHYSHHSLQYYYHIINYY
jgi:hypothetical protein